MGLKKFHEYTEDLGFEKPKVKAVSESKTVVKKTANKTSKKEPKKVVKQTKKVNESSFLVGQDYKVKTTLDVPQQLVQEYIDKVVEETGKNPLDNFNEAEIAEQMIDFVVKQNLIIDNLPSEFTVGSEPSSDMENADELANADSDELSSDMGEETPDEEFEIDSSSKEDSKEDDGETGDIEFGMEDGDIDEEIEVETEEESKDESESETEEDEIGGDFEEIEFDESEEKEDTEDKTEETSKDKPKTVADYLNKKEESDKSEEEEEENIEKVEDLYKKVGYKTGSYYESLNLNNLFKPY